MTAGRLLLPLAALLVGCAATKSTTTAVTDLATPEPATAPAGLAQLRLTGDPATLRRIAAEEDASGRLDRRRVLVVDVHRQLLLTAPTDALVPELYDLLASMAPRMQTGELPPTWASYVYTSYHQDLVRTRPTGTPRARSDEITAALDDYAAHYHLRAREHPTDGSPAAAPPGPSPAEEGFRAVREWRRQRRIGR